MVAPARKYQPTRNKKMSTNSYLFHQLQLYRKSHLEMRLIKLKKMVLINKTLSKRKKALYQTATQTVNQILLKYETVSQTLYKK